MLNGKKGTQGDTEIAAYCSVLGVFSFDFRINLRSGATSLFDVRRSMFDVGRSSFKTPEPFKIKRRFHESAED